MFRVDALVQVHADSVMLVHTIAKDALHRAVKPDALADVARHAMLGAQLDRLEPQDILRVEEHVLDNRAAFLALARVACKHNLFEDDAVRVCAHGGSVVFVG